VWLNVAANRYGLAAETHGEAGWDKAFQGRAKNITRPRIVKASFCERTVSGRLRVGRQAGYNRAFGLSTTGEETPLETVEEIFASLEGRFVPGVVKKPMSFYFSLDDDKWTVHIDPEKCSVEPGKTVEKADCFVKTSKDLFVKMYNGDHVPGMGDFMSGRIKSNNPYAMKTFVEAFSG
jgi:hypothetical protein